MSLGVSFGTYLRRRWDAQRDVFKTSPQRLDGWESMASKLSCAIWILTALFARYRPKVFTGTLQNVWRKGLIRVDIQRMKIGHYPLEKVKK